MKKYIKPQIKTDKFEVLDIITESVNILDGLAELDKSKSIDFKDIIVEENW